MMSAEELEELELDAGQVTCVVTVPLVLLEALESLDVLTVATFWIVVGVQVETVGSKNEIWNVLFAPGLSVKLLQRTDVWLPLRTQFALELRAEKVVPAGITSPIVTFVEAAPPMFCTSTEYVRRVSPFTVLWTLDGPVFNMAISEVVDALYSSLSCKLEHPGSCG